MKKWIGLLCVLAVVLALTGCGNNKSQPAAVSDVTAETESQPAATDDVPADKQADVSPKSSEGIDVDLTTLSSTMVYAEVYNMMVAPENYIGKTVKMAGLFSFFHDEKTNNDYFACIIKDATACCSQGIEFVLTDEYKYPDDYPKPGGDICVVGVFDTYQEGDYTYCTLRNANLSV